MEATIKNNPSTPAITVIVPCYNESVTVGELLRHVVSYVSPAGMQLMVVNDGSTDGTAELLCALQKELAFELLESAKNYGKGNAIRRALPYVRGRYTLVQDADLEYDPQDILPLLEFAKNNNATAVFGSRNLNTNTNTPTLFYWGGKLVTMVANLLYGQKLTDEPTGYKLIRTDVLRTMDLQCEQFEYCPEVVGKLSRLGVHINEIPIKYRARNFSEGKKIRVRDGIHAIVTLLRYCWWNPKNIQTVAGKN